MYAPEDGEVRAQPSPRGASQGRLGGTTVFPLHSDLAQVPPRGLGRVSATLGGVSRVRVLVWSGWSWEQLCPPPRPAASGQLEGTAQPGCPSGQTDVSCLDAAAPPERSPGSSAGAEALQQHFQPEGLGLLHGGDALRGTLLRLGAGAAGARGGGGSAGHQRSPDQAQDHLAVLRQPQPRGARRHLQAAGGEGLGSPWCPQGWDTVGQGCGSQTCPWDRGGGARGLVPSRADG